MAPTDKEVLVLAVIVDPDPIESIGVGIGLGDRIADLTNHGQQFVLRKGGRGGLGNRHFATATRQAPRFAQPGEPGQNGWFLLELRIIAEVGLVGYPNAGKSTLLNALTRSRVRVEDRLFATLDPASRRLRFPRDQEAIITDTVGFIRNLPNDLMEAFGATLEELRHADLLLHVIDASNPVFEKQIHAVEEILEKLELHHIPMLRVFNKLDLVQKQEYVQNLCRRNQAIGVSALNGDNLRSLVETMEGRLCLVPMENRSQRGGAETSA